MKKRRIQMRVSISVLVNDWLLGVFRYCAKYALCWMRKKPAALARLSSHHELHVRAVHGKMQDGQGDLEDIADALKSIQFSPTKPSSRLTALHTSAAGHPTAVQAATSHHASSRSRAPSLSSQRRNSFDERRIPPTLHEDPLAPSHTDSAAHASYASHSGARSRSGTASSHRLLRRISSDTVQSLDFDSDVSIALISSIQDLDANQLLHTARNFQSRQTSVNCLHTQIFLNRRHTRARQF